MANTYTYSMFAQDVIRALDGTLTMTNETAKNMRAKAEALLAQQIKRAEYSATHPSTKTPKGASAETKAKAEMIAKVLTADPKTAAEISNACGVEFSALQVANACKFIPGVKSCKVVRTTRNAKGLTAEREYTAYSL